MSALKRAAKPSAAPKYPPVRELIALHKERVNFSNAELAERLEYPAANVISMLLNGSMKLPMNKVALAAEALHIDVVYLSKCVDAENGGALSGLLEAISKRTPLTANEERLILAMRAAANNVDLNMDEHPQLFEAIVSNYGAAAAQVAAVNEETIRHLKMKKRSALAKGDQLEADAARKSD